MEDASQLSEEGGVTVSERLNELGIGPYQLLITFLVGGFFVGEGAEMLGVTSLARALDTDWGMGSFMRGFMVSAGFIGLGIGCQMSGPISDVHGRTFAISV